MYDPDFSPPPGLSRSLWRSLLINFADRFAPERFAPLQLTSKPVQVELLADTIEVPWYRTIFTNIGDVVSPPKMSALDLTSSPVDVGELLGDDLSHPWWNSLLQSLRDRLAPERLPALELSAQPVFGFGAESNLQILDWSILIAGPKIFHADKARPATTGVSREPQESMPVVEAPHVDPVLLAARMQLVRDIGRTRFRRKIWIALAAAEAVFLLVALFKFV